MSKAESQLHYASYLRLADYGFSYVSSEAQFRFPIALQIAFAILTFFGVVCLPESPRWVRQMTLALCE